MTPFNKSGGFKKPFQKRSFGGKPKFGGGKFGGHGKEQRGEMFPATCAHCGKACEVPFRPTGDRPVYCRDCFSQHAPARDGGDAPRQNFRDGGERRPFRPHDGGMRKPFSSPPTHSPQIDALAKQIETLNASIIKLISILQISPAAVAASAEITPAAKPKRKKK